MDEKDKKAFDFAADLTKQPITLATGTIALTITFSKDFLQKTPARARLWALGAWGVLLASVVFGIWTMMALTGSLGAGLVHNQEGELDSNGPVLRVENVRGHARRWSAQRARKQPIISVPPEMFRMGRRPRPTHSKKQGKELSSHGSPVDPNSRSEPRSNPSGPEPALRISSRMAVGEIPNVVTLCSIICQKRSAVGSSGGPSYSMIAPPSSR